jgi:hypothetical protein
MMDARGSVQSGIVVAELPSHSTPPGTFAAAAPEARTQVMPGRVLRPCQDTLAEGIRTC